MKKILFVLAVMLSFAINTKAQYGPRLMELDMFMMQMNQAMMQQQWNGMFSAPQTPEIDWGEVFKNSEHTGSNYVPESRQNYNEGTNNNSRHSQTTPTRRKCSYCRNGRILHESSVPSYGMTPYRKRCQECGFEYMSTTSHSHSSCGHCGGSGYIEY